MCSAGSGRFRCSCARRAGRAASASRRSGGNVDRDLFDRLSALRRKIAFSRGIPPYAVFPDSTLRGLADLKPTTLEDMGKVSGVGVVKLRQFGATFLKEIKAYLEEN